MTNQTSKWENCVTGKTWLQNHASHDAIECKAEVLFAELLNFRSRDLVTIRISVFCGAIVSNNSAVEVSNFFRISIKYFLFYLISTSPMEK